ncbi:alpha/beta fold hydrolase [Corynebacterium sp. sy039]|nr:alpha/beta fold hydrolase [Corynebacterium sp. sy039]
MHSELITLATSRHYGHTIKEYALTLPWDYAHPTEHFDLFAREIIPDGGENFPALLYLQGGPGFPAPRPLAPSGLIGEALKKYRVILLDQRGTGRSHRIDAYSGQEDNTLARLSTLRQENIVADAEQLRQALGIKKWSLFGQSFGGFCITAYLSAYPDSVEKAYLTGGLPSISASVDEVYRHTFAKLTYRQEQFFSQFPWVSQRIREVAHHLDNAQELLPTGERLSSRRMRTVGIDLGRGNGFYSLAYLFEDPFHEVRGEKKLKGDFLAKVGAAVSFAQAPLYAAIHESIYGGIGAGSGATATAWSAHRIREEIPGYEEHADPRKADKYYLTGEHIFPWQFDEDPALAAFSAAAQELAQYQWQESPYNAQVLAQAEVPCAAAVYYDDIFVPLELSMETAHTYKDCRLHITNYYQHDGIGHDGAGIFALLDEKLRDH